MNVVLVVMDTLRVDHLGCYGYFRNTSPNIDRFAAEGLRFEDFFATGVATDLAFTSIFTGLFFINHKFCRGLESNVRMVDDNIRTLPEVLAVNGFTTVAFDNLISFPSHPKHFVRGFNFYVNVNGPSFSAYQRADQVNCRLVPWIKRHSDETFFLFVHYWEPHTPHQQPEPYRSLFRHKKGDLSDLEVREAPPGYKYVPGWGRVENIFEGDESDKPSRLQGGIVNPSKGWIRSIDLYDGQLAFGDHAVGELMTVLKREGILDDTLFILTADHGEQLGQHYDFYGHAGLHDAVTHLPLIIRYPKLFKPRVVEGFAQHMDIFPTILDIVGIREVPKVDPNSYRPLWGGTGKIPKMDGQSLRPLWEGGNIRDRIITEGGHRTIRTKEWRLIDFEDCLIRGVLHKGPELYHVKSDPIEVINLAESRRDAYDELHRELNSWVESQLQGREDPMKFYP